MSEKEQDFKLCFFVFEIVLTRSIGQSITATNTIIHQACECIISHPLYNSNSFFLSFYFRQYPNLYATPGYHKNADEFNRVQRGHQKVYEHLSDFRAVAFIGGLMHPITCAGCGIVYCLGNYLYMAGYSDTKLDVKLARMKKGGPMNMLALLTALVCATKYSISLIKG